MANEMHVATLMQGWKSWNARRRENATATPDLGEADLSGTNLCRANLAGAHLARANVTKADLRGVDLSGADLREANFSGANLTTAHLFRASVNGARLIAANLTGANLDYATFGFADLRDADLTRANLRRTHFDFANLSGANLSGANTFEVDLSEADLARANLSGACLLGANLRGTNLSGANLSGADLTRALLVQTRLQQADLSNCRVYGIAAWDIALDAKTHQHDLVITPSDQPAVTVDNLEVAQFIYLLLRNESLRHVIDTITSKVVLILGRFTAERKSILDALRGELRKRDRLPVIFDFNVPATRDTHETVMTLARMARFIIADITDPKSIPQELVSIVEQLPSVAVQPILQQGSEPWGMYDHIRRYPWVLPLRTYLDREALMAQLDNLVIAPAEAKVAEIRAERTESAP